MNVPWRITCVALLGAPSVAGATCEDIEKRAAFSASAVQRDVDTFDLAPKGTLTRQEFEAYLRTCDRALRKLRKDKVQDAEIEARIDALIDEDYTTAYPEDACGPNAPDGCDYVQGATFAAQNYAVNREMLLFKAPNVPIKGRRFGFTRTILDRVDPRSNGPVARVPFIMTYLEDRRSNKGAAIVLGRMTYGPYFGGENEQFAAQAVVDFDVDTTKTKEKTSIGIGYAGSYTGIEAGPLDFWTLTVTPRYQTDRAGARDVVSVTGELTGASAKLGNLGQYRRVGNYEFGWFPKLAFSAGDVRDAAGNAPLAAIQTAGSYLRLEPGVEILWVPDRFAVPLAYRLAYSHVYDPREHWDRGYGETGIYYDIPGIGAQVSLVYRKGRPGPTFEPVDAILLGLGLSR
jgi:hypothetical protein